jgi:hypothetical protein
MLLFPRSRAMKTKQWVGRVGALGLFVWPAPPASAQAATTARLVVYRPYEFTGLPMVFLLWQDEQELCRLRNGRYITTTVPAGMVTLRSHVVGFLWPVQRERVLRFPAQAGATYYVQTDASTLMTTLTMALVPAAFAQEQLGQRLQPSHCANPFTTEQP